MEKAALRTCCFFNYLEYYRTNCTLNQDLTVINFLGGDKNLLRLKYACWEQK